jgi:uncharacterized membrane-anchored protein YhcB (DUF1043 family)
MEEKEVATMFGHAMRRIQFAVEQMFVARRLGNKEDFDFYKESLKKSFFSTASLLDRLKPKEFQDVSDRIFPDLPRPEQPF